MVQNKGLIFKEYVTERPVEGKHLVIETRNFDLEQEPPEGGVTLKNYYISFDPYQRGRMRSPDIKSFSAIFELNKPVTSASVSRVLKSANDKFKPGDIIIVPTGVGTEEYTAIAKDITDRSRVLHNPYDLDPRIFLGALGMPGLTAYSSFYKIGEPHSGDTIFISAASGGVGQLVGQLAKHEGLKVYGSVGDDKKLDFILNELKFDGGFNYKKDKPAEALKRLAPDGLDIYYDSVGGEQLEAALDHMCVHGRIVSCGQMSQHGLSGEQLHPFRNLTQIVYKRLKIQGFIVYDDGMGPRYFDEHQEKLQAWLADGSFKAVQHVTKGIDSAAQGLIGMLRGDNFGKALLEVTNMEDDPEVKKS